MKKIFSLTLVIFSLLFTSCEYGLTEFFYRIDEVNSRSSRIVNLSDTTDSLVHSDVEVPSPSSSKFAVLIFSDIHFGRNPSTGGDRQEEKFFEYFTKNKIDLEKYNEDTYPFLFSICAGDCVEHGFASEYVDYKKFTDKIKTLYNLKTYTIAGNHDLYNSGWSQWKSYCYPYISSYFFKTKYNDSEISWYLLDSGNGTLGYRQLNDLKKKMENDSNKKIVISHYPIYAGGIFYFTMQNTTERDTLISLFGKSNVRLSLEGHYHSGGQYDFKNYFHEEIVKSFLDKANFAVIYVDLDLQTFNVKQVDFVK